MGSSLVTEVRLLFIRKSSNANKPTLFILPRSCRHYASIAIIGLHTIPRNTLITRLTNSKWAIARNHHDPWLTVPSRPVAKKHRQPMFGGTGFAVLPMHALVCSEWTAYSVHTAAVYARHIDNISRPCAHRSRSNNWDDHHTLPSKPLTIGNTLCYKTI